MVGCLAEKASLELVVLTGTLELWSAKPWLQSAKHVQQGQEAGLKVDAGGVHVTRPGPAGLVSTDPVPDGRCLAR